MYGYLSSPVNQFISLCFVRNRVGKDCMGSRLIVSLGQDLQAVAV